MYKNTRLWTFILNVFIISIKRSPRPGFCDRFLNLRSARIVGNGLYIYENTWLWTSYYTWFLSACLRRLERRLGAYVVGTGKSRRAKEQLDVWYTYVYTCKYTCVSVQVTQLWIFADLKLKAQIHVSSGYGRTHTCTTIHRRTYWLIRSLNQMTVRGVASNMYDCIHLV